MIALKYYVLYSSNHCQIQTIQDHEYFKVDLNVNCTIILNTEKLEITSDKEIKMLSIHLRIIVHQNIATFLLIYFNLFSCVLIVFLYGFVFVCLLYQIIILSMIVVINVQIIVNFVAVNLIFFVL